MSRFAIRFPYLIIVICLITCVVGVTSLVRMPVDLFPPIKIPVVVVATFFNGMPPEQVETDITGRFERFFTLASGVDHIESRSLPGVSLIKIYFQPGFNADSAVTSIANLALADLRKLPPGTLPPVVLKFDASSLPVCLVTLKGEGLNEAKLRDLGQYDVRNQIANVAGASVPQPFGGKYRQIMVYVDPLKLEAHQLSVMDVVRSINDANLILPAGDVKIGPYDYNLYANSQLRDIKDIDRLPLKTVGNASVLVSDVGQTVDGSQIQNNIVRVDGQPSVYLPVLKQGGDANTISVVDGIKDGVAHLLDVPKQLVTKVVFDQSVFVRNAIENLIHEGAIGLVLTGVMILVFLGSMRATVAVFLSIPLSALAAFIALGMGDNTINAMVLGGLALAFSRLIDNSVVVLENIFRHIEMGETPEVAAERGGREVALPVLAMKLFWVSWRAKRMMVFFNPDSDLQGAGFHINQSLIAVATGGIGGTGYMEGVQKLFFLPEAHTDFIFANIAEEWGLIGAVSLLLLFALFGAFGLRAAYRSKEPFARLVAFGITTTIVLQAFFNISVVLALLPTKGIPLPLISSGGTSLFCTLASIGVLLNITKKVD